MAENDSENRELTKEDYNKIPVHYCKNCGSLNIRVIPELNQDYCEDCSSTDIGKASIEAWLKFERLRKNQPYNN